MPGPEAAAPLRADLVLSTSGAAPAPGLVQMAEAADSAETVRSALDSAKQKVLDKSREVRATEAAGPKEPATKAPMRQSLDSIEIELADGRTCRLRPPKSTAYKVATLIGNDPGLAVLEQVIRSLLAVEDIAGAAPPELETKVDLLKWLEQLGDDNVDCIAAAHRIHWPPMLVSELKVLKKTAKTVIS